MNEQELREMLALSEARCVSLEIQLAQLKKLVHIPVGPTEPDYQELVV